MMDSSEQPAIPVKQETENSANNVSENLEEKENSAQEESVPSPTTGDDPPVNPWSSSKCVLCEQVLTTADGPKLLECLHTACATCVSARLSEPSHVNGDVIVENDIIVCPVCNVHCHAVNIIENQFLLEAEGDSESAQNSKTSDFKCTSCHDNAVATSWCVECSEFICDGCVQAHQRLKITKEHTIKPKDEAEQDNQASASTSVPKSLYCSVHRQERLSLFCETCDKLTCRDCQLTDHRDHKYKFIHEIAAETRNTINGLLSEVSYKRVLLTSAMKVIDDRQSLIVQKKKSLVKEITHLVVKLTNTINARGKQLVMQLNEVCDSKQKTLHEKKLALEQLSNLTDHCIDFVNNALNKGSDMALLFSKRALHSHLQRIKSRRADIPNPEIPVRIHLAMEKVPDLIKVMSNIGGIVVDGRMYASTIGLNQAANSQSGASQQAASAAQSQQQSQPQQQQPQQQQHQQPSQQQPPPTPPQQPQQQQQQQQQHQQHQQQHQQQQHQQQQHQQQQHQQQQHQQQQQQQMQQQHQHQQHQQPPQLQQLPQQNEQQQHHLSMQPPQQQVLQHQQPHQQFQQPQPQQLQSLPPHHASQMQPMQQLQHHVQRPHPQASSLASVQNPNNQPQVHGAPPLHPVNRVSPQMHANRSSPHQNLQQGPPIVPRTMPVLRHSSSTNQFSHVQTVGLLQSPQNNHQVTSSTHPQTLGLDGINLRGLLSPHQSPGSYNMGQPVIRVSMSNPAHPSLHPVSSGGGYRLPSPQAYPQNMQPRFASAIPNQSPVYHIQHQIHHQQQQQLHQQQQQQARISPQAIIFNNPGARSAVHARIPSPQSSMNHLPGAGVQWHIPQHGGGLINGNILGSQSGVQHVTRPPPPALPIDESFKITLKTQLTQQNQRMNTSTSSQNVGQLTDGTKMVTSSVSKTPSPNQGRVEDAEKSLDTFCQESVNDLMATIAKLDRNGIEVVPEEQKAISGDVPLADSSTMLDEVAGPSQVATPLIQDQEKSDCVGSDTQKDDPNEDWCAVCMDGGELVCCDKCPKVFHVNCHIPHLKAIPEESETWQCLLCTNLKEIPDRPPSPIGEHYSPHLAAKDQKVAERILLELHCQYEPSLHFRQAVSLEVKEYHDVIKNPMSLDVIRRKLDPNEVERYSSLQEFISDIRLIFKNAYLFNPKDSQVYQDAKNLEEFFDKLLEKWLPAYAYESTGGSDDDSGPARKYRRIMTEPL